MLIDYGDCFGVVAAVWLHKYLHITQHTHYMRFVRFASTVRQLIHDNREGKR